MVIDHIFIFSNQGKEVDALVKFGLTEGSGRKHQGIGTANRRIFFENFYLEILWVENETEARSVDKVSILERSKFPETGYSQFGVCLKNTADTECVFESSLQWMPDFLVNGACVDILTNDRMPWIFRFPKNRGRNTIKEPTTHPANIHRLTKVDLQLREICFQDRLDQIQQHSIIGFSQSTEERLVLEFDDAIQGKEKLFESLNLIIRF